MGKIQRRKSSEQAESNGKNFAALEPGVSPKNCEPDPRECGVDQDRDSDITRHVAAGRDKFEPREQEKEPTARPNAEPSRIMHME